LPRTYITDVYCKVKNYLLSRIVIIRSQYVSVYKNTRSDGLFGNIQGSDKSCFENYKTRNAELTVLYITTPPGNVDELSDPNNVYKQMANQVVDFQQKTLNDFWDSVGSLDVKVRLIQEEGDPFIEIIEYTKKMIKI
jgi:hypothetical protein